MSGHSKWATIHRQKGLKDAKRGQIFSKFARAISLAAKEGPSIETNYKLRVVVEKARAANMPKENIERAISRAEGGEGMEEVTYEGFGPFNIALIIDAATDNRNRTSQEMKNTLEKAGGSLGGPGSVAFNFETVGFLVYKKQKDPDQQMMKLIDLGASDIVETDEELEVYVPASVLFEFRKRAESEGLTCQTSEVVKRPKNYQEIKDPSQVEKVHFFLEQLEDHDDVLRVSSNAKFVSI